MNKMIRVLLVDDDPVSRITVRSLLSNANLEIYDVENGLEAIQFVKDNDVDVIFMDLLMPTMDGITATKYIREMEGGNSRFKIIATSGLEVEHLEDYLVENQFDDLIVKPLNVDKIEFCLQKWFQNMTSSERLPKDESDNKTSLNDYFETIYDLNLEEGMKYSNNNIECYMKVVKTSIKKLQETITMIHTSLGENDFHTISLQLHSIKSVFYYVGATNLGVQTNRFETLFMQVKDNKSNNNISIDTLKEFQIFIQHITTFCGELEQATYAYYSSIKLKQEDLGELTLSKEEINEQIEIIMHHACRFEYVEIVNGLKELREVIPSEGKKFVDQAIDATEEFDYGKVKDMLTSYWNVLNEA